MTHTTEHQLEAAIPTGNDSRLRATGADVEELQEALNLAIERRNQVIVEAVDEHGMTLADVARLVHLSRSRVIAILAMA